MRAGLALRCGVLLLLGACGLSVGGISSPDGALDGGRGSLDGNLVGPEGSVVGDGSVDAVGLDAAKMDVGAAADATDGATIYTCAPPPSWANDCFGTIPCISTLNDNGKCIDRRADRCPACAGKICCVIGDSTVICVADRALCVDG